MATLAPRPHAVVTSWRSFFFTKQRDASPDHRRQRLLCLSLVPLFLVDLYNAWAAFRRGAPLLGAVWLLAVATVVACLFYVYKSFRRRQELAAQLKALGVNTAVSPEAALDKLWVKLTQDLVAFELARREQELELEQFLADRAREDPSKGF